MTFEKGSLILVDYTAKVKDSEEIFDTTRREDAIRYKVYQEDNRYQPKIVSIGEVNYPVLSGLDEALAQTDAGNKLTVEVTPDKGFGERDPKKVRMISIRKLGEDAEKVSVGDIIEIAGKKGAIRFIGSGRVQMDYNHKHAGKTIIFDVDIIKSLDSTNDVINEILKHELFAGRSKILFDVNDNKADIQIPEEFLRTENIQKTKHFIQQNIFKYAPTIKEINFIETYKNKQLPPMQKSLQQNAFEQNTAEASSLEQASYDLYYCKSCGATHTKASLEQAADSGGGGGSEEALSSLEQAAGSGGSEEALSSLEQAADSPVYCKDCGAIYTKASLSSLEQSAGSGGGGSEEALSSLEQAGDGGSEEALSSLEQAAGDSGGSEEVLSSLEQAAGSGGGGSEEVLSSLEQSADSSSGGSEEVLSSLEQSADSSSGGSEEVLSSLEQSAGSPVHCKDCGATYTKTSSSSSEQAADSPVYCMDCGAITYPEEA